MLGAVIIAAHIALGHRQHMAIMNVVWPLTALWAGPLAVAAYFVWGVDSSDARVRRAVARGDDPPGQGHPFPVIVGKGVTHCGSGCALGDLIAEWIALALPLSLFGHELFGAWVYDYVLAFLFGIAFQYLTIKPMRDLSPGEGLVQAIKADALSLTSWQVGMYGWMAIATFVIFERPLHPTSPVFWLMMQLGMVLGFVTAYPVNWWLIRRGVKERM